MKHLIKNARVVDAFSNTDAVSDILISNGKIEQTGKNLKCAGASVIEAEGKIVLPGLVDMHTHFREPGFEDKETIKSGSLSALKGGITTIAMMPNTEPCIDTVEMIKEVNGIIKKDSVIHSFIVAAITKGRKGEEVNDISDLREAGAVAVSDDGADIADEKTMLSALKAAKKADTLLIAHCEDKKLSGKGVMNYGFYSTKLGLVGIPNEAEYSFVKRNIELADKAGARIHIAHISTAESCEIVRKAKKDGVKVTAETAPHYFTLTEADCETFDTRRKINPPLRSAKDREAIKKAIADGTIDAIATDHAPHGAHDKYVEFAAAEFGAIGLETSLSLIYSELVKPGLITWARACELACLNPAKILDLKCGTLAKGAAADITVFDPSAVWKCTRDSIVSKSKNTPFIKRQMLGAVCDVFVEGRHLLKNGAITL